MTTVYQNDSSTYFFDLSEADEEIDEGKIENDTNTAPEKDAEYESDSDSELSVISAFSSSSESEGDGNFIVVPMPSGGHSPECKMCQSSDVLDFQGEFYLSTSFLSFT